MNNSYDPTWSFLLKEEFEKPYFLRLATFVKEEYVQQTIYPPKSLVFNAFKHCSLDQCKVVILGQDPYHGQGQAHGLSFSVPEGIAMPPSLKNIFKEISDDIGTPMPANGNLERWADQGVLLLNATLTVRANQAGSHQKQGWETFTDDIIHYLSDNRSGIVFMLWGAYAQRKAAFIDTSKHLVLKAAHPSPLSANRGGWFGNHHFSQANAYLTKNGQLPIVW